MQLLTTTVINEEKLSEVRVTEHFEVNLSFCYSHTKRVNNGN